MKSEKRKKIYKIKVRVINDSSEMKIEKPKTRSWISVISRMVSFSLVMVLIFWGISNMRQTSAYLSDVENSVDNAFFAGTLDFELNSTQIFSDFDLNNGEQATGTIELVNMDNIPKYKVKADNFSGELCGYLNLEANLDGGGAEYSGPLNGFDFGEVVFEAPDNWFFSLTLSGGATEELLGETCIFDFVFYGSQIKNNLPFGQGFTDEENANNNVGVKLCYDVETRSKGYWKNNLEIAKPYLLQMLGNEIIDSTSSVYKVLQTDYSESMRNKLKGQLLGMKFNIAHFGVGDYFATSVSKTINQIVAEADDLLRQDPVPSNDTLEAMKNLLESLVDLQVRACRDTYIKVIVPNCGEVWWVGRSHDVTWTSKNLTCSDGFTPNISIWYSGDSGDTWGNIIQNTENDGVYNWRVSLYLLDGYYVPSDKARVKIVASCPEDLRVINWDMSDCDFCPPIDFSLLTPEELEQARALGLIPPEIIVEEATTTDFATSTEGDLPEATTTEQTSGNEEVINIGGVLIIDGGNGGENNANTTEDIIVIEEPVLEETPVEEISIEEMPTETPAEQPLAEESVLEPEPVIGEQPVDQPAEQPPAEQPPVEIMTEPVPATETAPVTEPVPAVELPATGE